MSSRPTLLAFHGSGSNGTIHTVQLARLMRLISPHVAIQSLDGPFPSAAGPGILPFFDGCGPFKGWIPTGTKTSMEDMLSGNLPGNMSTQCEEVVKWAIQNVRAQGGKVVGLIGFSQGTRVVAGLLKASEIRRALGAQAGPETDWLDFKFGINVCTSYPPPLLPPSIKAQLDWSTLSNEEKEKLLSDKIQSPTFCAQGKLDVWDKAGQAMIAKHFEIGPGKSRLENWDNEHYYPVKPEESEAIAQWLVAELKKLDAPDVGM